MGWRKFIGSTWFGKCTSKISAEFWIHSIYERQYQEDQTQYRKRGIYGFLKWHAHEKITSKRRGMRSERNQETCVWTSLEKHRVHN